VLRATHSAPRLVLARHPVKERFDVFWVVQGRVVDWGPLPGASELAERTEAVLERVGARRAVVSPDEVDEVRIVSTWVAANEPPSLALGLESGAYAAEKWVQQVSGRDAIAAGE
jgi:hypothetical protein